MIDPSLENLLPPVFPGANARRYVNKAMRLGPKRPGRPGDAVRHIVVGKPGDWAECTHLYGSITVVDGNQEAEQHSGGVNALATFGEVSSRAGLLRTICPN